VTVAPAKVERVTPDDAEILDFHILRNAFGLQHSLARPLVDALRARARATEIHSTIKALPPVAPRYAQREVILVFDFPWLDLRPASFHLNLLLLGELKSDISARTETHQPQ
jgi:hypothetical protein